MKNTSASTVTGSAYIPPGSKSRGNGMPAFGDALTDEQLRDVVAYVVENVNREE